jgi:hypothetical protein
MTYKTNARLAGFWMPIPPFELAPAFWLLIKAAPNKAMPRTATRADA